MTTNSSTIQRLKSEIAILHERKAIKIKEIQAIDSRCKEVYRRAVAVKDIQEIEGTLNGFYAEIGRIIVDDK